MRFKAFLLLLIICVAHRSVHAQTIRGEVLDMEGKHALEGVNIQNVYTELTVSTDNSGAFIIAANGGQLLEFKKEGYKTTNVRIPQGYIPPYFRIIMKKGITEIKDMDLAHGNRYDFKSDSLLFHDLYKHELDFPKMSGIDMIASPFSALSRRNREIWQFQDDYESFEKEKYVDRVFNEALVTKFTGLTGDSLHYFMRRYRPSYEQVRGMNDYTFYNYIKTNAYHYKNAVSPRLSN